MGLYATTLCQRARGGPLELSECRFPMRAEQLCRDHSANCRCEGNSTVHDGHIIVLHVVPLLHGHMQGAECSSGTPPAVRRHTRSCAAYSYGTVVSPRRARPNPSGPERRTSPIEMQQARSAHEGEQSATSGRVP